MYKIFAVCYLEAYGAQWDFRFWSILGAITNFLFSVFCFQFFKLGTVSVILSTILVNFLFGYWIGGLVLYKKMEVRYMNFIREFFKITFIMTISCIVISWVSYEFLSFANLWITFICRGFVAVIISFVFLIIAYRRTDEFKYIIWLASKQKEKFLNRAKNKKQNDTV